MCLLRGGGRRRYLTFFMVIVVMSLVALSTGGAGGSSAAETYIVFRCGEGYANLCSLVPETGEYRQLTFDGDPHRPGTREYRLYHQGYRGPSISRDGKLLSFAFEGRAYIAKQNAEARLPVGRSTKVGFTSMRPDRRRLALFDRVLRCVGSPVSGVCRGLSTLKIATTKGTALKRVSRVWETDWAGTQRLVVSRVPDRLEFFSGPNFRNQRVLIEGRRLFLYEPAVSPDGRLVAVRVGTQHNRYYIAVISLATGKYLRRLTTGPKDSDPEWSPDGKQIVFSRNAGSCLPPSPCGELLTVPSDRRAEPRSLAVQGIQPTWGMRRDS